MPTEFPWLECTLILPVIGAAITACTKTAASAGRWSLGFLLGVLATALGCALSPLGAAASLPSTFAVDELSAPMLPVLALLHLITMLGTARSCISPMFCVRLLLSAFVSFAAITCHVSGVLVSLLVLGVLIPLWDLSSRGKTSRGYMLHMLVFVALLVVGWHFGVVHKAVWGYGVLLLALMLRGGILPLHGWVPTLFQGAAYGTAMLFILPLLEVLVAVRLLLPVAPGWMLQAAGVSCLITAVYGGGMGIVQNDVRRFYAYLCLSQTSLVLYAALLHTSNGLTASLCLWISSALALAGLAFAVRTLEARFGSLSLREHHGYYDQVPGLAICFLITGLASVGFPGTIGFVPMELLISGSVDHGLWVSVTLAIAAMLNGVGILRAYFALFTGRRTTTSVSLQVTPTERVGIILIALMVFLGGWFSPKVVASRQRTADGLLQREGNHPAPQPLHKSK